LIPRARVIPAAAATRARPLLAPGPGDAQRRRIVREELEGRLAGERAAQDGQARAEALLAQARAEAQSAAAAAARAAHEAADAESTAKWLALRHEERRRLERDVDRALPLAVALAERLLGAALELAPDRVTELARVVLAEARGARKAVVDAHPLDAEILERHLTTEGLDMQSIEVRADAALARGELRLHTDVGTIDARLAPRFERLAAALRDSLGERG
jgi:flagellar assembly protein FliH